MNHYDILLCAVFFGCVTGIMANKKGHGFWGWFPAGLLLGPFGVLWAWSLNDLTKAKPLTREEKP
jgi:hypothetical protein